MNQVMDPTGRLLYPEVSPFTLRHETRVGDDVDVLGWNTHMAVFVISICVLLRVLDLTCGYHHLRIIQLDVVMLAFTKLRNVITDQWSQEQPIPGQHLVSSRFPRVS